MKWKTPELILAVALVEIAGCQTEPNPHAAIQWPKSLLADVESLCLSRSKPFKNGQAAAYVAVGIVAQDSLDV